MIIDMTTSTAPRSTRPSRRRDGRHDALQQVGQVVSGIDGVFVVSGDSRAELPAELVDLMRHAVTVLERGGRLPDFDDDPGVELSSQQVADRLNVSRPFVVKLAREGRLPFRMVGNRHRFVEQDVIALRDSLARTRRRALAKLAPIDGYTTDDF